LIRREWNWPWWPIMRRSACHLRKISEGFKTTPGMHTVMVAIGSIDEKEEITEEWVKAQMKGLGWWPLNGPKEAE